MRDIRDDLRERLKAVELRINEEMEQYSSARRELEATHAQRTATLNDQRKALLTILNAEAEGTLEPLEGGKSLATMRLPLIEYFRTVIFSRGPQTKDDLKEAAIAAGYSDEATGAGRVTHATLLNAVSSGKLVRLIDGRYAGPGDYRTMPTSELHGSQPDKELSPGEEGP